MNSVGVGVGVVVEQRLSIRLQSAFLKSGFCNQLFKKAVLQNPLFKKAVLAKSAFLSDPLFAIRFPKCKSAFQSQRQRNSTFDK
jgi:hypothetical protein